MIKSVLILFSIILVTAFLVPSFAAKRADKKVMKESSTKAIPGLSITEVKIGSGTTASPGKTVEVHYSGFLKDGKKFDSSLDRREPLKFKLGEGRVIPGWEKGIDGMKVGGKRKLTIGPELAYGPTGAGGGNSTKCDSYF